MTYGSLNYDLIWTYLVLTFQHFGRVVFLISDINALQAMDVPRKATFVYVGFTAFNHFSQCVMDEDVLFFGLDQVIALTSDMFQE